MSARDAILGRLRASAPATTTLPDVSGWFASHQRHEDQARRIARLRAALRAVQTQVHDTSEADWPELLLRLARAKGLC